MPKTNWQDPGSSEVRSTHISGLQEAVGKIEDVLDMQLQAETGIGLSEVYISEQDRYRIFQAPEGKRNWASDPAPVIKKNGAVISSGFTIDYGGGAVIFSTPLSGTDTVTADFSRTKTDGNKLAMLDAADVPYDNTESELTATDTQAAIDETVDMVKTHEAETATQIALIKDKIGIAPFVKSWEEVQAIVRAGLAEEYFEIGDQFLSMYDGKVIVWTIIGIDHDTPTDTEYSHSLTIQTRDCLGNVQFDAPEPTNLDTNRQQYGNNRYIHSAIKQWLNSNDAVFNWVSQHQYDAPPTEAPYTGAGFLKLLDPELVAVIGAVDKQVAKATVDGGGQDLFSDKVFLLSRVEAGGGTEGVTDGEVVYPYYDGISVAGRIKLLNGSPRIWWLRLPHVSSS